jgi:S-adenosylmethionine:tRNA ribosyltransferase-isomerase
MDMADYDYDLPGEAIAQSPVEPRSRARLLDATASSLRHRHVADLPEILCEGDLLVVNETRVLPARLRLVKESGGSVELLLLERLPDGRWEAMVRPLRRCPPGTLLYATSRCADSCKAGLPEEPEKRELRPIAVVGERSTDGTRALVEILESADEGGCGEALGEIALPPYIRSPLSDPERYQTVFARVPGSVAAPTAGLHLTEEVIDACLSRGVEVASVDLAIGLDTFKPVTAERAEDHVMHSESYTVAQETFEACWRAKERGGRVVAVGTTVVRALETVAATGELSGRTDLFIRGDYPFRVVDVLMTNFHLPRSTLLLLVEAFCGTRWRELYRIALENGYRFLSFGDAMIVGRR